MAISIPFTFSPNTTILSAQVNSNFSTLGTNAVNSTGDTMTGTLTCRNLAASTDATYDIGTSGVKFRQLFLSGAATVGSLTSAGALTVSGSGASITGGTTVATGNLTVSTGSVSVGGNAIINSSGKIPAINTTNFASVDGSALTNLNASNLASGTVPNAQFPATLPAVSGVNLTNLNATNLASGTVADGRLSANVPLLNAANVFTAAQSASVGLGIGITTTTPGASGNINNLAITGHFVQINANAGGNTLTGVAGGASGRLLVIQIFNSGGTNTITDQDAASSAGNRFAVGTTKTFANAGAAIFVHDGTFWRLVANTAGVT